MNGRVFLSIAGLVVIGIAFYIIFEYPGYATYAFYLLILWMVTNFVLLYAIRPRGAPLPSNTAAATSPFPSTAPATLPAATGSEPAGGLGFCIYCATPIPPGTRACPACGHALPRW